MTTYYRVDLEGGISVEERPIGFYAKSEELGQTVFRSLPSARRRFGGLIDAEVRRLQRMRKRFRGIQTRRDLSEAIDAGGNADG